MADGSPTPPPPDFYIAAIGRSGSTMLSNWLSDPPLRIVFNEPSFLHSGNSRLLRIQLGRLGLAVPDGEWNATDSSAQERFTRLMGLRLAGRRWAAKEVLSADHQSFTEVFAPPRVLVCVRNIFDVALSFFEKHRVQDNLHRFGDDWVTGYCLRETEGILAYLDFLDAAAIPYRIVRYEDFTASTDEREAVGGFAGWPGGGQAAANLEAFGRGFEAARHGNGIGGINRSCAARALPGECVLAAKSLAERCSAYQRRFDYA